MSDAAPGASPAKKAGKAGKKVTKAKLCEHPKYADMIIAAIAALKERKGSSRQAILKYVVANNKVGEGANCNTHLKAALKRCVAAGSIKQVKGIGASGSFKLGEKPKPKANAKKANKDKKPKSQKPASKNAKKPAAKKLKKKPAAKKPAVKAKPVAAKKPAAKKAKKAPKKKAAKKGAKK